MLRLSEGEEVAKVDVLPVAITTTSLFRSAWPLARAGLPNLVAKPLGPGLARNRSRP